MILFEAIVPVSPVGIVYIRDFVGSIQDHWEASITSTLSVSKDDNVLIFGRYKDLRHAWVYPGCKIKIFNHSEKS